MLDIFYDSKYNSIVIFKIHVNDHVAKEKNIIIIDNQSLILSIESCNGISLH